ncbi:MULTISPECIES: tRNA lysidine(34) synthetase TilS [Bacillus]|uniref:tRNA(Ile)-lysidine synthase n=1 Tax=Bacillus glycinifermentans TaxID=1664069 RepID=A0AAJ4D0U2_9BACI|nr:MULTISPECIES: tRNA lysidine(34) synthetase TilS [Bacillus]KKB72777.1 tRNA(Ile)-lysidine synthetase [Bacillus sp. TH008]MBU8788632.1 tRNA lysidine(34) synthetase TilS [Bacillus glycinifermentans]MDU0073028.1 tRNA lysidine(34) synthetase TilS [Bacillus sp. IG6]MED8020778.1 tRNA lysidine(34) synthetase TilS [Bacillus glycinifermentans]QAT63583.1 tRNA lysidine(34) synthetase TilS [Bacillus glycinifermentans]
MKSIEEFMKKNDLSFDEATIIAGVSGGPDSMALLHALKYTIPASATLIAAHVDHMFRGAESEQDMRFVQGFCEAEGILCEALQINVQKYAAEKNLNKQAAAREVRFRFFKDLMEKHRAEYLALAHHGDDQIETMLMKLAKGTVGLGLAGIRPKRRFGEGWLIRPFLGLSKKDILDYCKANHVPFRTDPSNDKDDYTRNRFRHHVLPFLKAESEDVHKRFQTVGDSLAEDEIYLQALTKDKMNTVITDKSSSSVTISAERLLELPLPLQRRGVQLILNYLYENVPSAFSAHHIKVFLDWISKKDPSGSLDFPNGLKVVKSYHTCLFTFHPLQCENISYHYEINGADEEDLMLPGGSSLHVSRQGKDLALRGNDVFATSPRQVHFPLYVRTRQKGDRIKLKGMNGSKKVKDIFIDEKVPLAKRDSWPIVTDAEGRIIWIPGLKKTDFEELDVTNNDRIVLQYRQHEKCRGLAKNETRY